MLVKINQAAMPLGPSVWVFKFDMLSHRKQVGKKEANRADAYRYLTGEAEVGGWAAFLARSGAHAAVGAACRVLPFPPLCGCLSGRLSFGATSKEKQRQCQEHNAYRRRQGVGLFADCEVCTFVSGPQRSHRHSALKMACRQNCVQSLKMHAKRIHTGTSTVHLHMLKRQKQLVNNHPCFVFFRGKSASKLTSPKTCTSKKEALLCLHKCSTMGPGDPHHTNLLMIHNISQQETY